MIKIVIPKINIPQIPLILVNLIKKIKVQKIYSMPNKIINKKNKTLIYKFNNNKTNKNNKIKKISQSLIVEQIKYNQMINLKIHKKQINNKNKK